MKHFIQKTKTYLCCGLGLFSAACSEDIVPSLPGDGQEAYINFYNASEAVLQGATEYPVLGLAVDNMVYINDSIPTDMFSRFPRFNQAVGVSLSDIRQFPVTAAGDGLADNPGSKGEIFWMPIQSGSYRFIYTSRNRVYLKDTSLQLGPKEIWNQYLVESPEADDNYTIVSTRVQPQGMAGKTGVQLVHLAPDVSAVALQQLDANGNPLATELLQQLAFGQSGSLVYLDVEHADKNGLLFLKISRIGESDALLVHAVPAISAASYNLVLQGFAGEARRRLKIDEGEYVTVNINPNLRVNSRRMY